MNKAINGLNFSLLKKFQPHRLAYPLAFAMSAKCFDELNRPCRFFNIKNPRVSWVVEFVNKFLILLNEAFTSNNFARLDFIPIFEYIICPAHFLAFFTKAMSSSSVDLFLSSGNRSIKHHILSTGMHPEELTRFRGPKGKKPGEIRRALSKSELIQLDRHGYKLTAQGELALDYLRRHAAEIEAYLRRLLWSLPATSIPAPERTATVLKPGNARSRGYALPKARGDLVTQLAVAETIIAKGTAKGPLKPEHLRFWYTRQKKSRPVVLLLDASASMAGRRMAAAKEFARHLLVTSKEKVCVVIFQDSRVEVICDFTRNPRKLEAGLSRIQAEGLTPLAKGLETVGELCRGKMIKPLVLCVTDGIPTVPYRTLSPIEDAISAARNLAKQGIRIGCIGLQPNRSFLREMMGAARGSLYIVDELEASTMAAIARKEQKE